MTTLRDSDTKHNEAILHSYILTLIVPSLIVMAVTGGIPHNCPEFPHKTGIGPKIRNESGRNIEHCQVNAKTHFLNYELLM